MVLIYRSRHSESFAGLSAELRGRCACTSEKSMGTAGKSSMTSNGSDRADLELIAPQAAFWSEGFLSLTGIRQSADPAVLQWA